MKGIEFQRHDCGRIDPSTQNGGQGVYTSFHKLGYRYARNTKSCETMISLQKRHSIKPSLTKFIVFDKFKWPHFIWYVPVKGMIRYVTREDIVTPEISLSAQTRKPVAH